MLLDDLRAELRRVRKADDERQKKISFGERGLSDCFVSNAANSLSRELLEVKIAILESGGVWDFPALYSTDGKLLSNDLIPTKYGSKFLLTHDDEKREWVNPFVQEKILARKGYVLGSVNLPAWACLAGQDRGFSGMSSCYVKIFPADVNYAERERERRDES